MMEKKYTKFKVIFNTHILDTETNKRVSFEVYSESEKPLSVVDVAREIGTIVQESEVLNAMYDFEKFTGDFFRANTVTDFNVHGYDATEQEENQCTN
jgi:hypothetical protein